MSGDDHTPAGYGVYTKAELASYYRDLVWRGAKKATRSGFTYVYAIQAGESGHIKIGLADNPRTRVTELQVGNSHKLRLVHAASVSKKLSRDAERLAHDLLRRRRREGEWFEATIEEATTAIMDAVYNVDTKNGFFRMALEDSIASPYFDPTDPECAGKARPPNRDWMFVQARDSDFYVLKAKPKCF